MYPTRQLAEARAATLSTKTRVFQVTREYAEFYELSDDDVGKFILIVIDGPEGHKKPDSPRVFERRE